MDEIRRVERNRLEACEVTGLVKNEHGFHAEFASRSGTGTYKAQYWTEDFRAFKEGQITCNCKAWIFRRSCWHQDALKALLAKEGVV